MKRKCFRMMDKLIKFNNKVFVTGPVLDAIREEQANKVEREDPITGFDLIVLAGIIGAIILTGIIE